MAEHIISDTLPVSDPGVNTSIAGLADSTASKPLILLSFSVLSIIVSIGLRSVKSSKDT